MILSYEALSSVTFGAVRTGMDEDIYHPQKCTEEQLDAYLAHSGKVVYEWAHFTTGIRLDFYTDSSEFGFTAVSGVKWEVYLNGKLFSRFLAENPDTHFSLSLPEGENRVTLIFPSHSCGKIKNVTLDDGASLKPKEFKKRILFYGDSITEGWNSELDSFSYTWQLTLHYDADAVNDAVGGSVFCPDVVQDIGFVPDLLLVSLGTNDLNTPQDTLVSNVRETLSRLSRLYPNAKKAAVTPIWRDKIRDQNPMESLTFIRKTITEASGEYGFHVIDGLTLVPHLPLLYEDRFLHPNDLGFVLYYRNLLEALEKF